MSTERHAHFHGRVLDIPEPSEWECRLFGAGSTHGLVWRPAKGDVPNAFWRFMQFICFGNRWRKLAEGRTPSST